MSTTGNMKKGNVKKRAVGKPGLANSDDPESLKYPHDVIGIRPNEKRVGLFNQSAASGRTVADRMDAERSAALFYHALARLDYSSTAHPPSWYAQRVQQSPYPDLYAALRRSPAYLHTIGKTHTPHCTP